MLNKKILVILGPTASGKSDLGVRLAKKFKGEIISADSRQVYNDLNIGTGKITKKEMGSVPHHLLDVANPKKPFSVAQWLERTNHAIAEIVRKERIPIVVGGTGFYIDVLSGRESIANVPVNKKLRARLSKKSNAVLFKSLREKDPRRARSIDPHNKVRLIRALEIIKALGKVPNVQSPTSDKRFVYIGLKPDNPDERIRTRLKMRLNGMIAEGKRLHKKGLSYKRMHELGLEYRYVAMYLQRKLNELEMFNKLNTEIRRYAKRQMTWFKRNKRIKWFTLSAVKGLKLKKFKEIERYVRIALMGD